MPESYLFCERLIDGMPEDFFEGGETLINKVQAAAAQRFKALLFGVFFDDGDRSALVDQRGQVLVHREQFVDSPASHVSGACAFVAPFGASEVDGFVSLMIREQTLERAQGRRIGFFAL